MAQEMNAENPSSLDKINAVLQARQFLISLTKTKETPRVPSKIRKEAHRLLSNFPSGFDAVLMEKGLQIKNERRAS